MYWLELQDAYRLEQLRAREAVTTKLEQIRHRAKEHMTATATPPPICPECRDNKHGNCIGYALGPDDIVVECGCPHSER
jgi:hypothetical protein